MGRFWGKNEEILERKLRKFLSENVEFFESKMGTFYEKL
jgi:hypothetical protein